MNRAFHISVSDLEQFCAEALSRAGLQADDVKCTVAALVMTDAMGIFTHGTKLLAGYLRKLLGGGYRPTATPRVVSEGPAWAVVDGDSGLGQVGCQFAMQTAVAKASQSGIAYVGLRNTGHIGAAGYYAALAAQQGCIAMVTGNDIPSVAAPGSRTAVLGSNPLAHGIPVAGGDPILLDMATAAVAGGKVFAAYQRGEAIPDTWLVGSDGLPTTDGSRYPHDAALAPMAGYKGYGLALWCEILSGVLPGGAVMGGIGSWMFGDPGLPTLHNASFIAISVDSILPPGQFDQRLRTVIDNIRRAPAAEGIERVLLPGEREWSRYRHAQIHGIDLPEDVVEKLSQAAAAVGMAPLLLSTAA